MPERSAAPVADEARPVETRVVDGSSSGRALRITWLGWGIIAVGLLIAAGYGGLLIGSSQKNITSHQSLANDGNTTVTSEEDAIAKVAATVSPSVVSITTQSTSGSFVGPTHSQSAGTGIIIGSDGYIVTNRHVVSGTNSVNVITADGTTYNNVKVIGSDPLNDVAYIKVEGAKNFVAAQMGDSSTVRVGQKVVAIGNSLGQYQNTVTSGIISGTGRPISAQAGNSVENLTDLLQTDAAINPGNSGGPLLNLAGQVVGINTAIAQDAQGIGFAIPINATKGILKGVLAGKGVDRAFLGVRYLPITAEIAKKYTLAVNAGAYVYSEDGSSVIQSGGPAEKAGLRPKDIITKVNGLEVGPRGGVSSLVAEYQPGDVITLTLLRDGRELTVQLTLGSYNAFDR